MKAATLRTAALVLLTGLLARAASIEGRYSYGAKDPVTIRIVKGGDEASFLGAVVAAGSDRHRKQLGKTVLELKRGGPNQYRGRCNAYHLRLASETDRWLDVTKAQVLEGGNLRCLLQLAAGASVQIVYQRVKGDGPKAAPKSEPGELAGNWKDPGGGITHYVRYKDSYSGQIVKLSRYARESGFRADEETTRVKRVEPGVYKGIVKIKSYGGGKAWWEDIQITVSGDKLKSVRTRKDGWGKVRDSAIRLATSSEDILVPRKPSDREEGDLAGRWKDSYGAITRYERKGASYIGTIVRISSRNEGYGFRVGEEGVRLERVAAGTYKGKVKVKTYGGRTTWWEAIEATVRGDSLRYTRFLKGGGTEKGSATRIAGE